MTLGRHRIVTRAAARIALGLGLAVVFASGLAGGLAVAASPDPDVTPLAERLRQIDTDPQRNTFAAYERLQARNAVQALQTAKRKQRPLALQIARLRVESAELAVRAEARRAQLRQLEIERGELLVEASRRDAEHARAEAERLRVEAQIQAEETARLRQAIEEEARARQEAEGVLNSVVDAETRKLKDADALDAELARQEAELRAGGKPAANPKARPSGKKPTPGKKKPVR